jgi:hypothetical protein
MTSIGFDKLHNTFIGLAFKPQIKLIELCISAKTPEAPIKNIIPKNSSKGITIA